MSNMNFNCDVCGREVQGCTFVNGMKFCAKCYQETFGETDKDRKISDLEAKLAEIQNEKDELISKYRYWKGECSELKQQLHDLPNKIVEEIKENFDWKQCCEIRKYYDQQYIWFNYVAFNDFLDTILKKYGGEDD